MEGLAVNIEIVVAMGLFHREKEGRTDPRHPAHRGAQAAGSGQTGPLEKDEDRLSIWKAAVAHLHLRGSEPLARRFCGQIFPRSTYLYISLGIRSDAMKSRELWISLFLTARGVGALRANSVLARRNSLRPISPRSLNVISCEHSEIGYTFSARPDRLRHGALRTCTKVHAWHFALV